ncbi:capsular polysaccharide biosynthesis protein [Corticibacter populi]|uniref:Capsular polysaccharide biosynthesis protein n=1 Tax=Corticibacter populi TaxID=1550736 RepID=A0A3M6QMT1_9BURK|nr:capsular polysaccharide biosynthesis protein [Corticibacter populi]RMX04051.1 capsular polysaccharide biosynthesis protein [Corticibacter populi]RZS33052.1 capsular polysaccharide export protein [Corticibacter populi]
MPTIGVLSRGIAAIERLDVLLGQPWVYQRSWQAPHCEVVAAWGLRPSAVRAQAYAQKHGLPLWRLEDGFVRSVGLGSQDAPLSIVIDTQGIYYDAAHPSALEGLIATPLTPAQTQRADALMQAWRHERISKYNHLRDPAPESLPQRFVLVVDQTWGDASIRDGLADAQSFERMLVAAVAEHPDNTVLLKIHPDVFAGKKRGHFDVAKLKAMPQVQVLAEDMHPALLLERAEAVYVVTSQMGFEALLWGKPVRTFGMPFYAGWGLTGDELVAPMRRQALASTPISLQQLVHAALVDYPRYLDPETGQRCEPERLIEWLGLQRRMRARLPRRVYAVGFSWLKRAKVRRFLDGSEVTFTRHIRQVPEHATIALWGCRKTLPSGNAQTGSLHNPSLVRLEDGFLRSVGLGADLVQPLSWVVDTRGIYYDATCPSDLEWLLANTDFTSELRERAAALGARIVASGITKYNTGIGTWQRPAGTQGRRVLLVPGQVESDAALTWGAPGIRTNMALLQAVRQANPDAHVIYKPHPDVVARLRAQGQGEALAHAHCDEVVVDVSMQQLLDAVDEVHVLTSLAGFEALLRGRKVVTYGCPFYAGWGLTNDRQPLPQPADTPDAASRRGRALTLDELVACVLILYPTYVSASSGRYTTPERTLDELLAWRQAGADTDSPWLRTKRALLRLAQWGGWIKR